MGALVLATTIYALTCVCCMVFVCVYLSVRLSIPPPLALHRTGKSCGLRLMIPHAFFAAIILVSLRCDSRDML